MANFIGTLETGITADTVWAQITPVAGFIVTLTLVALSAYIIGKNLKSARKNKGGRV